MSLFLFPGVLITQLHAGDLKVTTPPGTEDAVSI